MSGVLPVANLLLGILPAEDVAPAGSRQFAWD